MDGRIEFLSDRYEISYVPSLHVLDLIRTRRVTQEAKKSFLDLAIGKITSLLASKQNDQTSLLIVSNPDTTLKYADLEVNRITKYFSIYKFYR